MPQDFSHRRTRIKICGITTPEDARQAVLVGADALGLVFYKGSRRCVEVAEARHILEATPPFVTRVALFVNTPEDRIRHVLGSLDLDLLQFHGDEADEECARYGKPWIKALRLREGLDAAVLARQFPGALGFVLDKHEARQYGGTGRCFDWSLVPATIGKPLILAGGLSAENVQQAIRQVRPWAVDVSSGVESAPGRKDFARLCAFAQAVRNAT